MLTTLQTILKKAKKGNYAVGAFNINNMEVCQAVINAAVTQQSPVIIATTEGAIKYAGMDYLKTIIETAAKQKVPTVMHLDHGRDINVIKKAIKAGYTGIMYDGSHLNFRDNIKNTKKVVRFANKKGIGVEGELGTIGGAEDLVSARKIIYTDVAQAKEFIEKTGVSALAVAIGTSHGAYKFTGKAKLDIHLLKEIKATVKIPLVLHGASAVPSWLITQAARFGADLGKPEGVPNDQITKAIENGINKINTDTDLRLAFDAAVRKFLKEKPADFDPRHILGPARELIQEVVEKRMQLFGSSRRAKK